MLIRIIQNKSASRQTGLKSISGTVPSLQGLSFTNLPSTKFISLSAYTMLVFRIIQCLSAMAVKNMGKYSINVLISAGWWPN